MSGGLLVRQLAVMPIGRRIDTEHGVGYRHMAGRGSMTSRGDGQRITTDAGCTTMDFGPGRLTDTIAQAAVGGRRPWSL